MNEIDIKIKEILEQNGLDLVNRCITLGGNDEEKQIAVLRSFVKHSQEQHECFYDSIPIPTHLKKFKKDDLFNTVCYKKNCSHEHFEFVLNFLHAHGYSIFAKNGRGETPFQACLANGNLSLEEKNYRFMKIASTLPQTEITKIINAIFNTVGLENDIKRKKWIERLQFAIAIDHKSTMEICATVLLTKMLAYKNNKSMISQFIDLLVQSLSGCESGFRNVQCVDKSLELFFNLNTEEIPTSNELIMNLINFAMKSAFNSQSEYKDFDLEGLGILIGGFADANLLLDMYQNFILNCLATNPISSFAEISNEIRMKMAIRATQIGNKMTPEIICAFTEAPYISGFISATIANIFDAHGIKPQQKNKQVNIQQTKIFDQKFVQYSECQSKKITIHEIKIQQITTTSNQIQNDVKTQKIISSNNQISKDIKPVGQFDTNSIKFFESLNSPYIEQDIDDVLEDTLDDLNKYFDKYPTQKHEIVNRVIIGILKNVKPKTIKLVKIIMSKILSVVSKNEIEKQKEFIEKDILPDIVLDLPCANQTWKEILNCL